MGPNFASSTGSHAFDDIHTQCAISSFFLWITHQILLFVAQIQLDTANKIPGKLDAGIRPAKQKTKPPDIGTSTISNLAKTFSGCILSRGTVCGPF
jgi:hypothetical protein